ncbi:MAG: hypothetical protein H5U18_02505 [Rhodobacteraceae bacterium]|nr:hypothetical protein [Paracoccaceae bacterium]
MGHPRSRRRWPFATRAAELEILAERDRRDLMDGIRCLVAEKYANGRVHPDWI